MTTAAATGLDADGWGSWACVAREVLTDKIERQVVWGRELTLAKLHLKKGAFVGTHAHPNEQITFVLEGRLLFRFGPTLQHERVVGPGEILHLPAGVPHNAFCLEDAVDLDIFTPPRTDWLAPGGERYFSGEARDLAAPAAG